MFLLLLRARCCVRALTSMGVRGSAHVSKGLIMPYTVLRITQWKTWYNELEVKETPSKGNAHALPFCGRERKSTDAAAVILVTGCEALSMADPDAPEFRGWEKRPWSPLCNVRLSC